MDIYRVAFLGHRKIYGNRDLEDRIEAHIKEAMQEHYFVDFYVGRNGDFDVSAASSVKRVQKLLGDQNSSLILVQPYKMKDDPDYENYYDELLYPIDPKVHFKAAIPLRNRWLIDNADLLICFVTEDSKGGAAATLRYAEKSGIEIINLANSDETYAEDYSEYGESGSPRDNYISDDEYKYEANKLHALLYLRLHHRELSKNQWYQRAYEIMLRQYINSNTMFLEGRPREITPEEYELNAECLDFLNKIEGKETVKNYKPDADFAVEYLKKLYT